MSATSRKVTAVALVAMALAAMPTANALGSSFAAPALLVGQAGSDACGSSTVDVAYDVAYDADLGGFGVSAARLSGLDERCQGYDVTVSLDGPGGAPLAEMTTKVVATHLRVAVPAGTPVSAEQLTGVSVVLRGPGA
ncbi:hypothetical protein Q6348_05490 [Isoptericola sp. b441]|uniref:Uncharacterized protein n=1 Tax=Actinotalea lenta TaxID=3064654 RepID=A0ABT9DBS3_9CELL|nr:MULTISPECIES: hypothetical protein [unclassified Isoptericola]MDO8106648.1 hypothetical protein [Isoptericola sp. b441]MDO8121644.1 hypothetical protein [Isoptericola sp. b490]